MGNECGGITRRLYGLNQSGTPETCTTRHGRRTLRKWVSRVPSEIGKYVQRRVYGRGVSPRRTDGIAEIDCTVLS